jgi:hypothetical protein
MTENTNIVAVNYIQCQICSYFFYLWRCSPGFDTMGMGPNRDAKPLHVDFRCHMVSPIYINLRHWKIHQSYLSHYQYQADFPVVTVTEVS